MPSAKSQFVAAPLAVLSYTSPKDRLFELFRIESQLEPEINFQHQIGLRWRNHKSALGGQLADIDPIVIPYLSNFAHIIFASQHQDLVELIELIKPDLPTFIMDRFLIAVNLSSVIAFKLGREAHNLGRAVTSGQVRDYVLALISQIQNKDNNREQLERLVNGPLEAWRRFAVCQYLQAATVHHFGPTCQRYFEIYRDYALSYRTRPDSSVEDILKGIESAPALNNTTPEKRFQFWKQTAFALQAASQELRQVHYSEYAPLQYAVEHFVLSNVVFRSGIATMARTAEDQQALQCLRERLIIEHSFAPFCAEEIIREACNIKTV